MKNHLRRNCFALFALLPIAAFAAPNNTDSTQPYMPGDNTTNEYPVNNSDNIDTTAPKENPTAGEYEYVSTYYTISIQSGNNQTLAVKQDSQPLTIQVADAETSKPVSGAEVVWSVSPADAAKLSKTTSQTDSNGLASVVVTPLLEGTAFQVNAASGTPISSDPDSNSTNFNVSSKKARISLINPQGFYGELDANRQALVTALDSACQELNQQDGGTTEEQNDLAATCNSMVRAVNDENEGGHEEFEVAASALGMMLPQATAAQSLVSLDIEKSQQNNVGQRLGTLRSGAQGAGLARVSLNIQGQELPNLASNATDAGQIASPWGAFLDGTITQGDKDKDQLESGFESDSYEITGGVDYRLTANTVIGTALGYANSSTDFDQAQGSMDTTGYQLSLYGTQYQTENFYTDAILTYGRNSHESKEPVQYAPLSIDQTFEGDTDGNIFAASIGGGYNYAVRGWTLAPYTRVEYRHVSTDGYEQKAVDTGAGFGSGLTIHDHSIRSLTGNIGGQVSYAISTRSGVFIPQLRLDYAHEFNDDVREVKAYLTNAMTPSDFTIRSEAPDTDYANVLLGTSAVFTGGRSAYAYYKTPIGLSQFSSNTLGLGMRWEF